MSVMARDGRPGNIKEGGYQPTSDPPPQPSGQVPGPAVNPITGNPTVARPSSPPRGQAGDRPGPSAGSGES